MNFTLLRGEGAINSGGGRVMGNFDAIGKTGQWNSWDALEYSNLGGKFCEDKVNERIRKCK